MWHRDDGISLQRLATLFKYIISLVSNALRGLAMLSRRSAIANHPPQRRKQIEHAYSSDAAPIKSAVPHGSLGGCSRTFYCFNLHIIRIYNGATRRATHASFGEIPFSNFIRVARVCEKTERHSDGDSANNVSGQLLPPDFGGAVFRFLNYCWSVLEAVIYLCAVFFL